MAALQPPSEPAALVRRYAAQYTKEGHKKTPLWHDGYIQVHRNKMLVLLDHQFTPLEQTFVPSSVTLAAHLGTFYLPDDFECNIGNLKARVESYESEFMAVQDLTEMKDAKKDARKRVRDWAAEEDSKSPGASKQSANTPAFKRPKSDAPSFRSPAKHTPLMPRTLKTQYKPSSLAKATYVKQTVDSPNDLSYLDDDSADEGTPASPYIQSGASMRLMVSLKGGTKSPPGSSLKSTATPGSSRKSFKVPKLAGTPLRPSASTPFKAPSVKPGSVTKNQDDEGEEEVVDQAAIIRSRLKVNWSAL